MKKNNYTLFTGLFLLLPLLSAAQVYHTDPNTNTVQANAVDNSNKLNGILLSNTSASDISIRLSDDKINWSTVKVPKQSSLTFQCSIKYVKIYTTASNFIYAKLTNGYSYAIYWDNSSSKWSIK